MLEIGDTLTIDHEIIGADSRLLFNKNDKVIISKIYTRKAHYSRNCPDIWIPEKIWGIKLVDVYGIWLVSTFKELKNETSIS